MEALGLLLLSRTELRLLRGLELHLISCFRLQTTNAIWLTIQVLQLLTRLLELVLAVEAVAVHHKVHREQLTQQARWRGLSRPRTYLNLAASLKSTKILSSEARILAWI